MAHDHHHPEDKSTSPIVVILALIGAVIGSFIFGYFVAGSPGLAELPDTTASSVQLDSASLPVGTSPAKGLASAPVTVVEFADFQCPGCQATALNILPNLVRDYGTENVRIVFKHYPLSGHEDARAAAQASLAARAQGKFWEYHDLLWKKFPERAGDSDEDKQRFLKEYNAFLDKENLVKYAKELNLDIAKFERDMTSPEVVAEVQADVELGSAIGVSGTPSFFVNGRRIDFNGTITYEAVSAMVSEELTKFEQMKTLPNGYYAYITYANAQLNDGVSIAADAGLAGSAKLAEGAKVPAKRGFGGAAQDAPERGAVMENFDDSKVTKGKISGMGKAPAGMLDLNGLPFKGDPNAKVTLLEYSDFQCPFCSKVNPTINQILASYPKGVRVAFVHHPLSFHKDAHLAAQASLAAHEQGKFWEYHDILFDNAKKLKRPDLERYAQQLQLDMNMFKSALDSGKFKGEVDKQMASARSVGISGTPGFAINGNVVSGAQPFAKFKTVIDQELARANKTAKETGKSGSELYYQLVKTAPKPEPRKPRKPAAPSGERMFVPVGDSPVYGDPNAPVTVIEFSDFECPFCNRGGKTVKDLVDQNKGEVKVVFKHNPLSFHKNAPLAHKASIAAHKQGKFWEYHDILFANQKALQRPQLIGYAKQLQLDVARFEKDMDSPEAQKIIDRDMAQGVKVSVQGTPHFFMNGTRIKGAQPLPAFQSNLDKELALAKKYQKEGVKPANLYKTIVEKEKPKKIELDLKGSPFKGPANAKVTLVEFSDFQCPFCSKVNPTMDALMEAYPKDLKIVFKQLPLNFHKDAHLAAQASLAAHEQGKFWEYHDTLFENQKALKRADLERYAQELGLNMTQFKAALDSGKFKKQVDADLAQAQGVGISGTPSFLINGEKFVGAQPVDAFKIKIDAALKK